MQINECRLTMSQRVESRRPTGPLPRLWGRGVQQVSTAAAGFRGCSCCQAVDSMQYVAGRELRGGAVRRVPARLYPQAAGLSQGTPRNGCLVALRTTTVRRTEGLSLAGSGMQRAHSDCCREHSYCAETKVG